MDSESDGQQDDLAAELATTLRSLGLHLVADNDVETIWTGDFMLPPHEQLLTVNEELFESAEHFVAQMQNASKQLRHIVAHGEDGELWQKLLQNKINLRKLIALVYLAMERVCRLTSEQTQASHSELQCALVATEFYWTLIRLDGAAAYQLFSVLLFQVTSSTQSASVGGKALLASNGLETSMDRATSAAQQRKKGATAAGHKHKKHQRAQPEDEDAEDTNLNAQQAQEVLSCVQCCLRALFACCTTDRVKLSERTVDDIYSLLMKELFLIDCDHLTVVMNDVRLVTAKHVAEMNVSEQLLVLLRVLASTKFDPTGERLLLQFVLPRLSLVDMNCRPLATGTQAASQVLPPWLLRLRDAAVALVGDFASDLQPDSAAEFTAEIRSARLDNYMTMIQNLLARCPDRSEFRTKMTDRAVQVLKLVQDLPAMERDTEHATVLDEFIDWLGAFSTQDQHAAWRVIACDMLGAVLRLVASDAPRPITDRTKHRLLELLRRLLICCSDVLSTVRQRALSVLAKLMEEAAGTVDWLALLMAVQSAVDLLVISKREIETDDPDELELIEALIDLEFRPDKILHACANDEKTMVRKAAVQCTESVLTRLLRSLPQIRAEVEVPSTPTRGAQEHSHDMLLFAQTGVNLLAERCSDAALSVRKQAAESLTTLLLANTHNALLSVNWLKAVLALVTDCESSMLDTVTRLVKSVLIEPCLLRDDNAANALAWSLLTDVESNKDCRRYLVRVLNKMQQQEKGLLGQLVTALNLATVHDQRKQAAWMLLSDLARCTNVSATPARVAWFITANQTDTLVALHSAQVGEHQRLLCYIASIIQQGARRIEKDDCAALFEDMTERVNTFQLHAESIPAVVEAIHALLTVMARDKQDLAYRMQEFVLCGVQLCEKYLSKALFATEDVSVMPSHSHTLTQQTLHMTNTQTQSQTHSTAPSRNTFGVTNNTTGVSGATSSMAQHGPVTEDAVIRRMMTMAELLHYEPQLIKSRMFKIIETVMCLKQIQRDITKMNLSRPQSALTEEAPSADGVSRPPTQQQQHQVPAMLQTEQQPLGSAKLRALAVVVLGKMCLHDESSANECVKLFVRELSHNKDHVIRNNCLIVLSDLLVRYTSVVEPHLSQLTMCIKDRSKLVRRQALTVLSSLLKEDYLRFKGLLLYRFMTALLDVDVDIRAFAEFCLINVLKVRHPKMFDNHFLECLYHFNGVRHSNWQGDDADSAVAMDSLKEQQMFTLRGRSHSDERERLYTFMLEAMDDGGKFGILAKLTDDVLTKLADEEMHLDKNTDQLIADTLKIMASDAMKLQAVKKTRAAEKGNQPVDDELDPNLAALDAVAYKAVSDQMKRVTLERILPALLEVKKVLSRAKSRSLPLVYDLLKELLRDFKDDVDKILEADPQLAIEVRYDIEECERKEAKEQKRKEREAQRLEEENRVRHLQELVIRATPPRAFDARRLTGRAQTPLVGVGLMQVGMGMSHRKQVTVPERAVHTCARARAHSQRPMTVEEADRIEADNNRTLADIRNLPPLRMSKLGEEETDGTGDEPMNENNNDHDDDGLENACDDFVINVAPVGNYDTDTDDEHIVAMTSQLALANSQKKTPTPDQSARSVRSPIPLPELEPDSDTEPVSTTASSKSKKKRKKQKQLVVEAEQSASADSSVVSTRSLRSASKGSTTAATTPRPSPAPKRRSAADRSTETSGQSAHRQSAQPVIVEPEPEPPATAEAVCAGAAGRKRANARSSRASTRNANEQSELHAIDELSVATAEPVPHKEGRSRSGRAVAVPEITVEEDDSGIHQRPTGGRRNPRQSSLMQFAESRLASTPQRPGQNPDVTFNLDITAMPRPSTVTGGHGLGVHVAEAAAAHTNTPTHSPLAKHARREQAEAAAASTSSSSQSTSTSAKHKKKRSKK